MWLFDRIGIIDYLLFFTFEPLFIVYPSKPACMKPFVYVFLFCIFSVQAWSQEAKRPVFFEPIEEELIPLTGIRDIQPSEYVALRADTLALKQLLWSAPHETEVNPFNSPTQLSLPLPDGSVQTFRIVRFDMMEEGLAQQFPGIATWRGVSTDLPRATVRLDWTQRGFHAMVRSQQGNYLMDPYCRGNNEDYVVYFKKDYPKPDYQFTCDADHHNHDHDLKAEEDVPEFQGDCTFRTYRLAMATTGEYSNFHGAFNASQQGLVLSAVTTAMNRVNGIYEEDIAVRMVLIANTTDVFYYNPATDPYTNNNGGAMLGQNQTNLDNVIGSANYDIGHVFSTGGGGVAVLNSVCSTNNKARGVTGLPNPIGDPFYVDYVSHEIGHQFGATHTQYNSCQRTNASAMEPGSASTILGYAGICAPNVQNFSDDYFHAISLQQMGNFVTGFGGSCAATPGPSNGAPTVNGGLDYSIPRSTPFILSAVGSDPNGDPLVYCWEQWNNQGSAPQPPQATNTQGPMFRTFKSVSSPDRYFPNLTAVVNNTNPTWEVLPSVARTMNFRVTVRDYNGTFGCTDEDDVVISTASNSGPFLVTSPNTPLTWQEGSTQTVTWNVAGSTSSPVSCPTVDIFLSYDGGFTYPATLATAVTNNGTATITVPTGTTNQARVMVKGHNHVFYDISNVNFTIVPGPPVAAFTSSSPSGCAPHTVNFQDQSTGNPISWAWSFPGGVPATSTQQNPSVTYPAPGVFGVTLVVTNSAGNSQVQELQYVTVETTPTPFFSSSVSGNTVLFTNGTIGFATGFQWNFGDGNTSTLSDPSHTYANDGTYQVTLTATNGCGSQVFIGSVTIISPPTAGFSANQTQGCAPFQVNFINQSSANATSFSWTMPGATPTTSTMQNPMVVYTSPGVYTVTLVASNSAGSDQMMQQNFIVVLEPPTAAFTSSINLTTVSFNNQSTNATSYSWDFGDGNGSTDENPSHTYDVGGTYTVTLTASNACGDAVFTETLELSTVPAASFTFSPVLGCAPQTVQFTDQSSSNVEEWLWEFPGGNPATSTLQNPSVLYELPGLYDVTLTVSNSQGSNSVTVEQAVLVGVAPGGTASVSVNQAQVDMTSNIPGADTYAWDFGDGNGSTEPNASHTYASDGTYTIILMASNNCGEFTFTETVTIVTPPTADFIASPTAGCAPLEVQFTDFSSANTSSWQWTFAGGNPATSNEPSPTVLYEQAGVFDVQLIVSNAAGSDTLDLTNLIVVTDVPDIAFSLLIDDLTVTFQNTTTNADSYFWDFGDGATSTEESPTHTYAQGGAYTATLTATNSCGDAVLPQSVPLLLPPEADFSSSASSGCAPFTVQFTDASLNATSWLWEFEGGTPASSTEQNPEVVYNTAGVYSVTLTVGNASGESTLTTSDLIQVFNPAMAAFGLNLSGLELSTSNSSQFADTYFWDFGDGNTSTEFEPLHTYATDGVYIVTLTASNSDCGPVSVEQTIEVVTPPQAGFTFSNPVGCLPLEVQYFDASSSNATSWNWTFEGGFPATSSSANPTVTYPTPGVFNVSLTVSNAAGESTFALNELVVVGQAPTASFAAFPTGGSVVFVSTTTNADTYFWSFGDGGTSTQPSPTHNYSSDGQYTVVLTVGNACGQVTFTQVLDIVIAPPSVQFQASSTSGCAPFEVSFSNFSSDNTDSFQWLFPGGTPNSSTEANPVVVYNSPGVFDVMLIGSNALGSDTMSLPGHITVGSAPVAGFTVNQIGGTFSFTNTSTGAVNYFWSFGNGEISTAENPSVSYTQAGNYVVTLIATNSCGSVSVSQTVGIQATIPVAAFGVPNPSGCAPMLVQFSDQSSGTPTSWQWSFPGGNPASSTMQNPAVVYNSPGTYSVTLVVSNAAGSNSIVQSQYIQVNTAPVAGFTFNPQGSTIAFSNTSNGATSYQWDFGDGNTSTMISPVHTYDGPGNYSVALLATNACGTTAFSLQVPVLVSSVQDWEAEHTVQLFPNPNDGFFTLRLEGPSSSEPWQISLYDLLGRRLWHQEASFQLGYLQQELDVRGIASGLYLLELRSGNRMLHRKVRVE
jgi:PKD repeat protein